MEAFNFDKSVSGGEFRDETAPLREIKQTIVVQADSDPEIDLAYSFAHNRHECTYQSRS